MDEQFLTLFDDEAYSYDLVKDDISHPDYINELVENDAIDNSESGFLRGFTNR